MKIDDLLKLVEIPKSFDLSKFSVFYNQINDEYNYYCACYDIFIKKSHNSYNELDNLFLLHELGHTYYRSEHLYSLTKILSNKHKEKDGRIFWFVYGILNEISAWLFAVDIFELNNREISEDSVYEIEKCINTYLKYNEYEYDYTIDQIDSFAKEYFNFNDVLKFHKNKN